MARRHRRIVLRIVQATFSMLVLGGCVYRAPDQRRASQPPSIDAVPRSIAAIESDVAERVNDYRRRQGLSDLAGDSLLTDLARDHSRRMASGRRAFGHDGFEGRADRVHEERNATSVSENVAYNNYPADRAAERVVKGWIESPGHRENMIGSFNRVGTGAARTGDGVWYVTQLYASVPAR